MHRSALFLDRDGVINVDRGYIHRSDQFEFVPGIFELARFWTNEPGRLIVHCPYHPLHGIGEYRRDHPWRKPNPGMILQAVSDLSLDPAQSVIVGDKMSDIEAGEAAGIGLRILVASRDAKVGEGAPSHEVVADLGEALALLRSRFAVTVADRPYEHP